MTAALSITVLTLLALAVLGFGLHQLVALVRSDGAGRPQAALRPPRSHTADTFEPSSWSRAA